MSDTYIQKSICEAIDIIARQRVAQANFDRTIKAVIDKVIDKTTGEYSIKYQDSKWTAYATNSDIYYETGQQVNVLIPGNDFNRRKTILNGVGLKSTNYVQIPPAEQSYNSIGGNFLQGNIGTIGLKASSSPNIFYLYKTLTEEEIENGETNLLDIDTDKVKKYLKESNGLALSFYVQTQLDEVQQAGGAYGLCLSVTYEDDQGNDTNQVFYVDMLNGIGNPFNYITPTKIENFTMAVQPNKIKSIDSVYLFTDNFPKDSINEDIFFSNIMICGGVPLTTEEINGYTLHINFPNGNELKKLENENSFSIKAQAQLKVKGRIINSNVLYYWCRRNGTILSSSEKYFSQAGQGWECLNSFNGDNAIGLLDNDFYFSTEKDDPKNKKANAPEKNTQILCVAIYNGHAFTKKANVINYNVKQVKIISSDQKGDQNKTTYYFGAGHPILQCQIFDEDNKRVSNNNYVYSWTVTSNNGKTVTKKLNTDSDNEDYAKVYRKLYGKKEESGICEDNITSYDSINEDGYITIKNTIVGEENQNKYIAKLELDTDYTKAINNWKAIRYKERIKNEYYIYFPVNTIVGYVTISCSVNQKIIQDDKQSQNYIGTGSITLYNKLEVQGMYSLNIQNGTKVFQYDDKGNSPCGPKAVKPLELQPLTFTLFDNTGKQISYQAIINNGTIRWLFPKNNTLLTTSQEPEEPNTLLIQPDKTFAANYNIYKNRQSFSYSIVNQYDSKKTNNDIRLYIQYKGLTFDNYTNFTFPKDGDPGTNGTDFFAKIVPVREDGNTIISTQRIYISDENNEIIFSDNGEEIYKLNYQLYNNSIPVSGTPGNWICPPATATTIREKDEDGNYKKDENGNYITKIVNDNRQNLITYLGKNGKENSEISSWQIPKLLKSFSSILTSDIIEQIKTDKPVNIIRAQQGTSSTQGSLRYFAEFPICTQFIKETNTRLKVKSKTGFNYVVYEEDGTRPNYDDTFPFEIIVQKYQNEFWRQIEINDTQFTWYTIGNIEFNGTKNSSYNLGLKYFVDENNVTDRTRTKPAKGKNKCFFKPKNTYDGSDLSSAIIVQAGDNILHIPIYIIINRYNHTALNGWDGNSIELNANGDTILAPQIGAGKKEIDDNTFTGVLMGDIKTNNNSQTGLMGYHHGVRTIFLDSKTGKAQFGKNNAAKIIIDPSQQMTINNIKKDVAFLYSNQFNVGKYKENNGASKSDNTYGAGLMIDLTSPTIQFGSGNFYINSDGHLHASGGGDIAGWTISDSTLYKSNVGMNSNINNSSQDPNKKPNDTSLSTNNGNMAFWAGEGSGNEKNFYVTHSGYLFSKSGKIGGWNISVNSLWNTNKDDQGNNIFTVGMNVDPEKDDGKVFYAGKNKNVFYVTHEGYLRSISGKIANWTINKARLSNGNVGMGQVIFKKVNNNSQNPFGEAITARFWGSGSTLNIKDDNDTGIGTVEDNDTTGISNLNFAVSNNGKLYSKAGKIGGWNIQKDKLWAVNSLNNKQGVRLGSDGNLSGGAGFNAATKTGGKWAINTDGSSSFTNIITNNLTATDVDATDIVTHNLTANDGGQIAGWTIDNGYLKSNGYSGTQGIQLSSSGSMQGPGWSISSDGIAYFSQIYGSIASGQNLTGNGFSLGSSGGSGGSGGGGTATASNFGGNPVTDDGKLKLNNIKDGNGNDLDTWELLTFVKDIDLGGSGAPITKTASQLFETSAESGAVTGFTAVTQPQTIQNISPTGLKAGDVDVTGSFNLTIPSLTINVSSAGTVSIDTLKLTSAATSFCTRGTTFSIKYGVTRSARNSKDAAPKDVTVEAGGGGTNTDAPQ